MSRDVNKKYDSIAEIMSMKRKNAENRQTIAVFDSGIGGIPYLQWIREKLPAEDFVYLADRENFPYGEKDDRRLRDLIVDAVGRFIEKTFPALMVIACNTASVVALAELRRRYDIPFVGVVPAIKPAAALTRRRSIGVLATRRTVEDPYTAGLIRRFASDCRVSLYPGVEIVDLVENRLSVATEQERKQVLRPAVDFFREKEVDTLVVACTHFVFVQEELAEMMGDGTRVIDSREGVGRQVIHLLEKSRQNYDHGTRQGFGRNSDQGFGQDSNKSSRQKHRGNTTRRDAGGTAVFFISSKEEQDHYRRFTADFDMEWGGVL